MAFNIFREISRLLKDIWRSMFLQKKIPEDEESELGVTLNTLDVFLMSIGVLSRSFFQEMPHIVSVFGYMIFFPLFLGGIMSYITSMCYAELIAINANSGGSYRYIYYTMGEFMAFWSGWTVIAFSSMSNVIVSRFVNSVCKITKLVDTILFNSGMSNFTAEYLPVGDFENDFISFNQYLHFETIFASLAITVSCSLLIKYSKLVVNVAATLNIMIIAFCISIFWFYMDLSQFNIIKGTKDFSFFTKGVVQGNMFYMDFEVVLYAGKETWQPSVTLPKGLENGFKWGFIIYIASVILYSMRETEGHMEDYTPMQTALSTLGFQPFHVLPTIGLGLGYFLSADASIFILSRIIHTMANDGMMFPVFKKIHSKGKNPLIAIVVMGCICAFLAITVGDSSFSQAVMVVMLNSVRILVLISFLVTRYRCEQFIDSIDPQNRWILINYPRSVLSPTKTTQTISMLLIFLSVITIIFGTLVLFVFMIESYYKQTSLRIAFIISIIIVFTAIHFLHMQPQNDRRKLCYMVRGVPFTPIMAIAWYILIMILIPDAAWIRFACWMIIGILFYFSYVCMRTKEFIKTKEETIDC